MFNITANYEVASYDATKKLVLSNLGADGGKNTFLGEAFQAIGSLCLVFGIVLLVKTQWTNIQERFFDKTKSR